MNRNHALLLGIVLITLPLIWLFVPESQPGSIRSLEGVTLSTVSGQKFKFSGLFSDKPVLLAFWSVTCGTCIEEIPFLIELHEKYKNHLTIIGVHMPGFGNKRIQRFLRSFGRAIPYQLGIDDDMTLVKAYEITIIPKTILINPRGEELYSHLGFEADNPTLEKEIEDGIRRHLKLR